MVPNIKSKYAFASTTNFEEDLTRLDNKTLPNFFPSNVENTFLINIKNHGKPLPK